MTEARPRSRPAVALLAMLCAILGSSAAIADDPDATQSGAVTADAPSGHVECLLPADVERLGKQLTFLGAQRKVLISREDCLARAGEVVADDPAAPETETSPDDRSERVRE